MPSTRESLDQLAVEVCHDVDGRVVGAVQVVGAEYQVEDTPEGGVLVSFELTLADPAGGQDTWPVDDLLELQSELDQLAVGKGLDAPWQVSIHKQTQEQYDEDPKSEA